MKPFLIPLENELKLNIRNMNMVIFVVIMPFIALVILGFIHGTKSAVEGMVYIFTEQSSGTLCCTPIYADGLTGLPLVVSGYRKRKISRRFQVTPVSPTKLLTVELVIYMIYYVVSTLTLSPVAMLFWEIRIHDSFLSFLGSWSLAMVLTSDISLSIGEIVKNMKSASAVACILYFPMPIFSGATLPFEAMLSAMQKTIGILPLTQGIQLMEAAFLGSSVDNTLLPIVTMCAVTIICFGISIKYFKRE